MPQVERQEGAPILPREEASYAERYCAFIDILGFGGLISASKVPVGEIYRVLSAVHARPKAERPQDADLRSQSISDAVALSAALSAAGFHAICSAAEELSRRLLRQEYFARGGITKGKLYHDYSMVFGPALIEAYRLESEIAKFPRILIPRSVVADGAVYAEQGTHWKNYFEGRFLQADDGPFFLHILCDQSRYIEKLTSRHPIPSVKEDTTLVLLSKMRDAVQKRFDEASDNPDHFQKVAWFVKYWNNSIQIGIEGLKAITTRPL
jgi:hypothetical protein